MPVHNEFFRSIIGMLFASIHCGVSSQFTQHYQLRPFQELRSVDDYPACSVLVAPYMTSTASSISCCTIDCKLLKRQTSNSLSCVGFNYFDQNDTCQLFTNNQRLYFAVQPNCRYLMNLEETGPNPPYNVCPKSFAFISANRGCYKPVTTNANWNTAALFCQALVKSAHLVFINDSQENAALSSVALSYPGCQTDTNNHPTLWIGLQFRDPNVDSGPLYWKFNSTTIYGPMTYTNWNNGEPNDAGGAEHCGAMQPSLMWNDLGCGITYCFICELDL